MSKINKTTTKPKRRRPTKKLVTTLKSLTDALPVNEDAPTTGAGSAPQSQVNIFRRKSMKSKPGALKRRQKVDKNERDRFQKNMAQLLGQQTEAADKENASLGPSAKWSALRGFISQTLEVRPDAKSTKT